METRIGKTLPWRTGCPAFQFPPSQRVRLDIHRTFQDRQGESPLEPKHKRHSGPRPWFMDMPRKLVLPPLMRTILPSFTNEAIVGELGVDLAAPGRILLRTGLLARLNWVWCAEMIRFGFITVSSWGSIRAQTMESVRVIQPLRINEVRRDAGQGVCPNGLPARQIGTGLDHNGLIDDAAEGEAKPARFHTRAAGADLRRGCAEHHGGLAAICLLPAGGAVVPINRRARTNVLKVVPE